MKDTKLYRVELGLLDDDRDAMNWRSSNVVAKDAPEAVKKTRLRKNEYVVAVALIATIDRT